MHSLPKKYYFIKNFNTTELRKLNSNTAIILRNYEKNPKIDEAYSNPKTFNSNENLISNKTKKDVKTNGRIPNQPSI